MNIIARVRPRLLRFRSRRNLLYLMAAAVPVSFAIWSALLNNFVIEQVNFNGAQIGVLQSLREVPGFLAFAAIFFLLIFREQTFAIISLLLLGLGTALTGIFPSVVGLYCTTVLMSIGFHYYETMQTSLSLQWFDKKDAPWLFGKLIAVGSFASLIAFAGLYIGLLWFPLDYTWLYILSGATTIIMATAAWLFWPTFEEGAVQHKKLLLRKRYWLYYLLTFLAGARRQIFVVFAGFMMVEKFHYDASAIAFLFLINCAINIWLAPIIGRWVGRIGEKYALGIEYIGLIIIFVMYAFVENAWFAAVLYLIDHLFFAMAIAIKTYFQKIADPADIASTAGISFTINHIAAVILPAILGLVWLVSPSSVFLIGAAIAVCSLLASQLIPNVPAPDNETDMPRLRQWAGRSV